MKELLFWVSAGGLVYIYLGYPVLVWLMARLRPRPVRKAPYTGSFSVVIAAYNEAESLPKKIRTLLASESAGQISEIIVGSDGSSDGTVQAVKAIQDARIRVVECPGRRGKSAVLNDLVPQCQSDVVVLTDARQEIAPGALAELLSNLADERVGVVSGELVFRGGDSTAASTGIDFYWRYEKFIRRNESRFGSVPGATGALYAIRKGLFRPIHPDSLLDDVAIPMQAVMQGSRCVFEEQAVVFDRPSSTVEEENIRKRRTIAGNAQLIRLYPGWLLPWKNPIWFQCVSHKFGRLLSPFLLVGVALANGFLFARAFYQAVGVAQAMFYLAAMIGWLMQKKNRGRFLLAVPLMFVNLNVTTALALSDAMRGRFRTQWIKSDPQ